MPDPPAKKKSTKLGAFFPKVTCAKMNKEQKRNARVAEAQGRLVAIKVTADAERVRKRELEEAGLDPAQINEWRENFFDDVRIEIKKKIARHVALTGKVTTEENSWRMADQRIVLKPPAPPADGGASAGGADPEDDVMATVNARARGSYTKWTKEHKEQAIAAVRACDGCVNRGLAHLQNDEVVNVSGAFDKLARGTLNSWFHEANSGMLGGCSSGGAGGGSRQSEYPQNQCPIAAPVRGELKKILTELGAAGGTLNSTTIYPQWYEICKRMQPALFTEPQLNGHGVFKLSTPWINKMCAMWGFTMQRKTTTAHHLSENWEELVRLSHLRLAFLVRVHKIPRALCLTTDETPVKAVANSQASTRHLKNSGEVSGIGKDNKLQFTAIPFLSAEGDTGASTKEEREQPGYEPDTPELPTVMVYSGVEYCKRANKTTGHKAGDPATSSCPMHLASQFPEFVMCQTPSHFARFSTVKIMFERVIVPYFEKQIERLGLVGAKQIEALKRAAGYDPNNPEHNPEHQKVGHQSAPRAQGEGGTDIGGEPTSRVPTSDLLRRRCLGWRTRRCSCGTCTRSTARSKRGAGSRRTSGGSCSSSSPLAARRRGRSSTLARNRTSSRDRSRRLA